MEREIFRQFCCQLQRQSFYLKELKYVKVLTRKTTRNETSSVDELKYSQALFLACNTSEKRDTEADIERKKIEKNL